MRKIGFGWIWGIIIILAGVGFLLESLGFGSFGELLATYWPGILILIGLVYLLSERYFSGLIWIVLGVILGLFTANIIEGNVWQVLWPLLIIVIGLRILFRPRFEIKTEEDRREYSGSSAIFGGASKKVTSKNFRGTSVSAIFGGAKLDLRASQIAKEGAVIDVDAIFGGVEIFVPANAKVKVDVFAAFGGHDDKRDVSRITDKGPEIFVRGNAIFGGIEIKS